MNSLFKNFNALQSASTELVLCLLDHLRELRVSRKDHLLTPDLICRNIYFVETGTLLLYTKKDNKVFSSQFMKEGDLCVSFPGFFFQTPSTDFIIAMEDSLLYYLTYPDLQFIQYKFPAFSLVLFPFFIQAHIQLSELLNSLRTENADMRYQWLKETQPELIERVPGKYIASYIGISDVLLSILNRNNKTQTL